MVMSLGDQYLGYLQYIPVHIYQSFYQLHVILGPVW